MVRRIALAWVMAILAATSAPAQIPISRDLVPKRSAMARLGLEQNWMALVPLIGTERLTSISLAAPAAQEQEPEQGPGSPGGSGRPTSIRKEETVLFAQTNRANFYAFDAESGRMLWRASLGHDSGSAQPASVNSRLVFVTNSSNLFALERHTGRVVWVQNLDTLPTSPTACDEQHVMVGLSSGKLTAFDIYASNDKKKALYDVPRAAWNWQTGGGALTSRPLPAQQFVTFGGRDGKLYVALSELPADLIPVLLYRLATGGEIFAPLGAYGTRTVLVPSADNNVYAVDLFSASVKWTYPSGAPVMQMPLAADKDVYSVNRKGLLTSLDAETGKPRWMTSTHGGRLISISATKLYLESHDDDLFIVDRGTGQMIADARSTSQRAGLNLRDYDLSLTNDLNDRLYLATRSGMVISIREIGQTRPRPLRDPKLPPFGTIPPEGALTTTSPTLIVPETPAENAVPAP